MTSGTDSERILVVGDASSIARADLDTVEVCRIEIVSSLSEAAEKQSDTDYDRVIIDPSALSGPVLQVLAKVPCDTVATDIAERKSVEGALNRQRDILQAAIDSTSTQIAYLDSDFRFMFANSAYVQACGHTWEKLAGRNHFEVFPNEENEAIFRRARDTGTPIEFKAKPFEFADQPWRGVTYWDWTLVPVKDSSGETQGLVFSLMDVTHIKRAEAEILRTNERLRILSDTSSELLLSDNPQRIVQSLCERVMEHLDCHVFFNFLVVEEKACLNLNAWAGIPDEEAQKIEWLDYGVAVCGCVARDGCRIVTEDIMNTPDERTELVKGYGILAYACHPLLSEGGKVIGTLSFGTRSRTAFAEDELSLMKTIADQVATAMEKVRVTEREHHIAEVLQQALVPAEPPKQIDNYRFAVRYQAALKEASVGGDFYDIFDLGDDRVGVLIGDVVGKGLAAAIRVAAARYSIRSYSYLDPRPGRVLTLANDALSREPFEEGAMLTAFFAVLDTRVGVMAYSNAGHEPPIVVDAHGDCREVRLPGLPLGILGSVEYLEGSLRLNSGDKVVMLTDGITEARHSGSDLFGAYGVLEYLGRHHDAPIGDIADGILEAAKEHAQDDRGDLQDDAAIIVFEQVSRESGRNA